MVGKRVKADDVARIVQPIVDALEALGRRMDAGFSALAERLERVERNTADTADAVRRLERSSVGVGRAVALEERVSRIEKHLGLEPG